MERLKKIASFIDANDIVADIGCDHGYLIKIAIEENKIKYAYAIDNKIGPLNQAKNNLKCYNNVKFILSDGLLNVSSVDLNKINTVVIAGMGGLLINKIINDSLSSFKQINKIILSPHNNIYEVRKNMNNLGFKINDEAIICDETCFYEIIEYVLGNEKLNDYELNFGPVLLKNKNKIFYDKWNNYLSRISNFPTKLNEIKMIKEVLNNEK